jgi:hypothetical protein
LAQSGLHSTSVLDSRSDTEIENFLRKLNDVDFSPIASKLIDTEHGEGLTIEQATAAIEDYRRFLFLIYIYPDRIIVPTRIVDLTWHHHILDTQKYEVDCMEVFNYFVHHFPYFGMMGDEDKQASDAAFEETRELWNRHFN